MSSELLHALDPEVVTRRDEAARPDYERPEFALQPVLVRPPDSSAHRSELEYAVTEPAKSPSWAFYPATYAPAPHAYCDTSPWASPSGVPVPHYDQPMQYTDPGSPSSPSNPTSFAYEHNAYSPAPSEPEVTPSPVAAAPRIYTASYDPRVQLPLSPLPLPTFPAAHPGSPSSSMSLHWPSEGTQWQSAPHCMQRAHQTATPPQGSPRRSPSARPTKALHNNTRLARTGSPVGPARASARTEASSNGELARMFAETRHAADVERERRLAWELEQERRYKRRQAEMELQMLGMKHELVSLKTALQTPVIAHAPCTSHAGSSGQQHAPVVAQTSQPAMFVQGSSQQATPVDLPPSAYIRAVPTQGTSELMMVPYELPSSELGPLMFSQAKPCVSSEENSQESEAEVSPEIRARRKAYKEKECVTIQTAMRKHILRTMCLSSDKALPDSHDGSPLASTAPVRFVWTQTVLKSPHNQRMRACVVDDLIASRSQYKHVQDSDFEDRKALEAAFDQAFSTLRTKWRAQRIPEVAVHEKKREDAKTTKSRRTLRKKAKLANRSDVRNVVKAFSHASFNGALQLACMSSEESASDSDASNPSRMSTEGPPARKAMGRLITRPPAWRSAQLYRFYDVLDDAYATAIAAQPKRGAGKKERVRGQPKASARAALPPKGVGDWMVSKRWRRTMKKTHPGLDVMLRQVVDDMSTPDEGEHDFLGESSDEEDV